MSDSSSTIDGSNLHAHKKNQNDQVAKCKNFTGLQSNFGDASLKSDDFFDELLGCLDDLNRRIDSLI